MKQMDIEIWFKDSPGSTIIENVDNLITEGGLLRIFKLNDDDHWYPLCHIHCIKASIDKYRTHG